MGPAQVLAIGVNLTRIEVWALRLWLPVWGLLAVRCRVWHLAWSSAAQAPMPSVRRVVLVGHGQAETAGASGWQDVPGVVVARPADIHSLCPNAARLDLWVCYQGRFVAEWQAPWVDAGSPPPEVRGHAGPVLGPFAVPEWLADGFGRLRSRLGL